MPPRPRCDGGRCKPGALALLAAVALLSASCSVSFSVGKATTTTSTAPSTTSTTLPTSSTQPGGGESDGSPPVQPLVWHTCGTFQCSTLVVPVSYSDPHDGTLKLAVIELRSTGAPAAAGDVVLNPGGPGASGVQFLQGAASEFPASLRAKFNLVSFDPRGVGESDPVVCASSAGLRHWIALDPDPATPAAVSSLIAAVKAFDRSCRTPRDVLANLSTAVTARDMDRLRVALGQSKLDYLGFSYGTYLGALYAQAFPSHVGNMVLDGAIDPALGAGPLEIEQADSFEVDLHDFFAWCPTNAICHRELPAGAAVSYGNVIDHLKGGGTLTADLTSALGGVQQATYGVALTGVISSLYTTSYWPYLAEGLAEAASGNGTVLTELAYEYAGFNPNGTAGNLVSANLAVSCLDRPSPPVASLPALAQQFAKTAPDFGPAEAWGSLACNYWPVAPTGRARAVHLPSSLPILVVGSTHDPATPYAWAKALSSELAGSRLLTRTGDGHTGYFSSTCVQGWVDNYLIGGHRPPEGTVCASNA
jgi:pimeloyl-ACP methyl ester carboxylesterase